MQQGLPTGQRRLGYSSRTKTLRSEEEFGSSPVDEGLFPALGWSLPMHGDEPPGPFKHPPVDGEGFPALFEHLPIRSDELPTYGRMIPALPEELPIWNNKNPVANGGINFGLLGSLLPIIESFL